VGCNWSHGWNLDAINRRDSTEYQAGEKGSTTPGGCVSLPGKITKGKEKMKTTKKIKRIIAAVVVGIAAFFELCFTGNAVTSWRLARNYSLSSRAVGANNPEHPTSRPGIFVSRVTGRVSHSFPPGPALKISRLICIGKYMAMLIFLAFVITVFVTCPSGRSFATEDDNTGTVQPAAMTSGTEAPSSFEARMVGTVCTFISITLGVVLIAPQGKSKVKSKK